MLSFRNNFIGINRFNNCCNSCYNACGKQRILNDFIDIKQDIARLQFDVNKAEFDVFNEINRYECCGLINHCNVGFNNCCHSRFNNLCCNSGFNNNHCCNSGFSSYGLR